MYIFQFTIEDIASVTTNTAHTKASYGRQELKEDLSTEKVIATRGKDQ